jgi:hypothetical protein
LLIVVRQLLNPSARSVRRGMRSTLRNIEDAAAKLGTGDLRRLQAWLAGQLQEREAAEAEGGREEHPSAGREVVDVVRGRGCTYQQEYIKCGKRQCRCAKGGKGHGPYWYKYWREGERVRSKYVGKTLRKDEGEQGHSHGHPNGNGNGNGHGAALVDEGASTTHQRRKNTKTTKSSTGASAT